MGEKESDASRLRPLLKNYKCFSKSSNEDAIQYADIKIKSEFERNGDNSRHLVHNVYFGDKKIELNQRDKDRVRDVFNRVFYCEPDDTPVMERLCAIAGYLAVCSVIFGFTAASFYWFDGNKNSKNPSTEIANVKKAEYKFMASQSAYSMRKLLRSK